MKNITKLDYFICLICSLFASLNSDLNPLVNFIEVDSGVFLYIGKMMHRGYIPYLNIFDHKGIILYWIQYFGMFLSPQKLMGLGVWLIEIIHFFVFIVFIYLIARLFIKSKLYIYTIVLTVTLIGGCFVYVGCNLTETYSLPWITMSLYYFIKYLMEKKIALSETILVGVSFAIVFFLQPNLIALWIALSITLIIYFIKNKNIKDFKLWLLGFVSGALMVLIIVFGYLLFTHSLKDMIYCYLIFNFKYTGSGPSSPLIVNMFKTMILLCGKTLITLPLIVLTLFNNYKNKIYIINLFYFVVSLLLISLKGIPSSKYAIVLLPSLILFCVFFYLNLEKLNFRDKARQIKFINILSVIFIFGSIMLCIFGVFHRLDMYSKRMPYSIDYLRSVNENSDVLVLTNDCGVNLLSDRQTHNKYPYQFPPVEFDNVLYDDFLQRFKDNPSDYVILEEKDKEMFGNFASMIKIYDYLCELSQAQVYKHIVYDHFEVFVLNKELIND